MPDTIRITVLALLTVFESLGLVLLAVAWLRTNRRIDRLEAHDAQAR